MNRTRADQCLGGAEWCWGGSVLGFCKHLSGNPPELSGNDQSVENGPSPLPVPALPPPCPRTSNEASMRRLRWKTFRGGPSGCQKPRLAQGQAVPCPLLQETSPQATPGDSNVTRRLRPTLWIPHPWNLHARLEHSQKVFYYS
jgi:hypothetical protein